MQEQLDGFFLVGRLLREAMESVRVCQHAERHYPLLTPTVVHSGHHGQPKFNVPECQLMALGNSGFTGMQICGVSLSTVRRRMVEYVSS